MLWPGDFMRIFTKTVPSAWLIFTPEKEKANTTFKNIFLLTSQLYGSRILKICENWQKICCEEAAPPDRK